MKRLINKTRSPVISSPFNLRTEKKAARRQKKLEEKFNANEAQKVQLHTKLKVLLLGGTIRDGHHRGKVISSEVVPNAQPPMCEKEYHVGCLKDHNMQNPEANNDAASVPNTSLDARGSSRASKI